MVLSPAQLFYRSPALLPRSGNADLSSGSVGSSRRGYHFCSQLVTRLLSVVCSRLASGGVAWKPTQAIVLWIRGGVGK